MEITIKMGEIKVAKKPAILTAVGVGSCVVVTLYERDTAIGAMGHIVLPRAEDHDKFQPARFADVAIGLMIDEMKSRGAGIRNIKAKIFGGANMFPDIIFADSIMDVGKRNIEAVKEEFEKYNIEIVEDDVGDIVSRTVVFDVSDGLVKVKTI